MIKITLQSAIDAEFGTFEDEVHESVYFNESAVADAVVLMPYSGVWSFETGGGLSFEWVLEPDMEEEDE